MNTWPSQPKKGLILHWYKNCHHLGLKKMRSRYVPAWDYDCLFDYKYLPEQQSTKNHYTCIRVRLKYEFFPEGILQITSVSLTNFGGVSAVYVVDKVLKSWVYPF